MSLDESPRLVSYSLSTLNSHLMASKDISPPRFLDGFREVERDRDDRVIGV